MKTRLLREAKEGFMEQRQHLSPYHSVSSPSIALWTLLLSQSHKVHSINSILWTKKPRFKKPLLVKIHWGTLLRCYFLNLAEGSFSFKGLLIHFSGDRTGLNGYMRQYMQGPSMNSSGHNANIQCLKELIEFCLWPGSKSDCYCGFYIIPRWVITLLGFQAQMAWCPHSRHTMTDDHNPWRGPAEGVGWCSAS